MRPLPTGIFALLACAGLSMVIGQTVEDIDVQAIKKRSADMADDAQAFVDHVKHRGKEFQEEAVAVREAGTASMREVASKTLPSGRLGPVDFDEIVRGAAGNANRPAGDAPQFIVFASLSMPGSALKPLIRDTASAGGVVVFRGFPNNSAKQFADGVGKLVEQRQLANVGVDPRLFRAFNVQAVPTFVTVSSDFDLCAGFACTTKVPPHDQMIGNVTVEYALASFADGRGPGAGVAAVALGNLRRAQ